MAASGVSTGSPERQGKGSAGGGGRESTAQGSVRPRRRLDEVRRPQILATTVELIRERGLWDVRLADVAKHGGMSATSVVYYFGSKDQLFAQAIAEVDDAF